MDAYDRNGGAEAMELGPNRYDEPKVHECIVEGCYEPMLAGYEACTKHALEWAREEHVADPFDNGLWENYCELLGIARAEGLAVMEDARANPRLIAAAPDMLEVLNALYSSPCSACDEPDRRVIMNVSFATFKKMEAAIAKATGGGK